MHSDDSVDIMEIPPVQGYKQRWIKALIVSSNDIRGFRYANGKTV